MPKYFRSRKAEEVKKFLEAHKYSYISNNGDDEIWARDDCKITVKVPSRNEVIPIGTMEYIKRCIEKAGIDRKDILSKISTYSSAV